MNAAQTYKIHMSGLLKINTISLLLKEMFSITLVTWLHPKRIVSLSVNDSDTKILLQSSLRNDMLLE